jgi:DNA-binding transcriptional MocR family regulator
MGDASERKYLRLAYSFATDHEIERGIMVLGESIAGAVRTVR